jgi:hypothetical protein
MMKLQLLAQQHGVQAPVILAAAAAAAAAAEAGAWMWNVAVLSPTPCPGVGPAGVAEVAAAFQMQSCCGQGSVQPQPFIHAALYVDESNQQRQRL